MALEDEVADALSFRCEHCGQEASPSQLKRQHGVCGCGNALWAMHADYEDGEPVEGIGPYLTWLVLGVRVRHSVRTIHQVTHNVPAEDVLPIVSANSFHSRRAAFHYAEMRRKIDGAIERDRLRDQGGRNCDACGAFYVPSSEKPWTNQGCCSKACFAARAGAALTTAASAPAPATGKEIAVKCRCGCEFSAPSIYAGTRRKCPRCDEKIAIPVSN